MSDREKIVAACHCVDVDFGSYDNQVSMKTPKGDWVSIDTCIATTIGYLWHMGVDTLNSCCGHGKIPPSVIVSATSYAIMDKLGYRWLQLPNGRRNYLLKETS